MTIEWIPGTDDPEKPGLKRGLVPGSWSREIPEDERHFSEEKHRPLLVKIAEESGSQAMANFISDIYKLKERIILPNSNKNG